MGISPADLACPWKDLSTRGIKPSSWEAMERLVAAGTAGVMVPSFAKGAVTADVNVVFWNWASDPPHQVRVVDYDGRLPRSMRAPGGEASGSSRSPQGCPWAHMWSLRGQAWSARGLSTDLTTDRETAKHCPPRHCPFMGYGGADRAFRPADAIILHGP
jgi:hypothetical protein